MSTASQVKIPVSHQQVPEKPIPGQSLLASAQRLTKGGLQNQRLGVRDWQADAWDMFDLVGEEHFLVTMLAGRLSQARLYVGKIGDDVTQPPIREESGPAFDAFEAFAPGNRSQLLNRMAISLSIAGEHWLAGVPRHLVEGPIDADDIEDTTTLPSRPRLVNVNQGLPPEGLPTEPGTVELSDLVWHVVSVSEISSQGGKVQLKIGPGGAPLEVDPTDVFLIRVWRPHPRHVWEADSPARSSLPVLHELVSMTMNISAQIDSRLAGAGILLVPSSAARAVRTGAGMSPDDNTDPFTEALIEAMMTAIKDRASAAAVVPLVITVPDESVQNFRHISFSTPLDGVSQRLRDESIRRLALGQDAPPELLLGTGGISHWGCVDTQTEILTHRGWMTLDTLREDDTIFTLDHTTGLSEWQPIEAIQRYEVVNAPMLRMQGQGHDSLTTLNHRWAVTSSNHGRREFVESRQLNTGHHIPTGAPCSDLPTQAKYSDAFVELVAWYWTEGWRGVVAGRQRASITQSHSRNPDRVNSIRAALVAEFGDTWGQEYETPENAQLGGATTSFRLRGVVRAALDEVAPGKRVSLDFVRDLTRAQLELFIHTSCAGDGWHYRRGELDIWQKDRNSLAAYELALILSGRMVSWSEHAGGHVVNGYTSKNSVRPIKAGIDSREEYTGTIWCPTVGNSTWLARRNGTVWFTGNSWLIREDVVTTHLEPPLALICDALTAQFLHPVLEAAGLSEEEISQYVVWYDVSHLITRPNRFTDAKDLYEKGVISAQAYRDAGNFTEGEAPEEEKLDMPTRMALDMVQSNPGLLASPGLGSIVEQLTALFEGGTIPPPPGEAPAEPEPDEATDETEQSDTEHDPDPDTPDLPDTQDNAPAPDQGAPE